MILLNDQVMKLLYLEAGPVLLHGNTLSKRSFSEINLLRVDCSEFSLTDT